LKRVRGLGQKEFAKFEMSKSSMPKGGKKKGDKTKKRSSKNKRGWDIKELGLLLKKRLRRALVGRMKTNLPKTEGPDTQKILLKICRWRKAFDARMQDEQSESPSNWSAKLG